MQQENLMLVKQNNKNLCLYNFDTVSDPVSWGEARTDRMILSRTRGSHFELALPTPPKTETIINKQFPPP